MVRRQETKKEQKGENKTHIMIKAQNHTMVV